MKVAIILAVIVIPLAYSLFYLGAFWDPYGRLSQLPVAVVNEDSGAEVNGAARNFGSELVDELTRDNEIKWVKTDAVGASGGLNGTQYYAVITIPDNFSRDIASADTADKHVARITYSANEKRNFLAAQILNRAVLQLEEKLETKVDEEITSQLTDKLREVPSQLRELSDGLGDMSDGAARLDSGLAELKKGQNDLAAGAGALDGGLGRLLDGSETLDRSIAALHSGIAQTKSGVKSAMSAMSGAAGQTASLTEGMQQLVSGAQQVSDGLSKASGGAAQLSDAVSSKTSGIPALVGGIDAADDGAGKLEAGVGSYVDGVGALLDQENALMTQLSAIETSPSMTDAQKVAAVGQLLQAALSPDNRQQLQQLAQSGSALKSGAAAVAAGTAQLKAAEGSLSDMQGNIAELSAALKQLSGGAAQVSGGVNALQKKAGALSGISDSMSALTGALDQLDSGSRQLYDGAQALTAGLASAKEGADRVAAGATQLQDGTTQLQDGAKALSDGIGTAKSGVDDSISTANDDLKAADGLPAFASNPVDITESPVNPVPNYGTAFGPYFISLSLYVGAIIMFVGIYLDSDEKIPMLSRDSGRRFVRVGVFALIGVVQAVALALIVHYGLGIKLAAPAAYYLSCILVSMVFISIVEFFMVCLKDAGKFLSLLLLILQLTSCGGTFPMETVPKFFNVLYPFMPMTYSVTLFKETISGYDGKSALTSALILAGIGICFTVLTMLFSVGGKVKQKRLAAVTAAENAN